MTFIRPAFKFAPPPATQAVEIKFNNSYNKYVTVGYSFSVVGTKPKERNLILLIVTGKLVHNRCEVPRTTVF